MRKETRKYLCAELRDYQQSVNEMLRLRDRMEMLQYPAYRADCGSKKAAYIETRIAMLQEIVGAIDSLRREISEEDEKLLQLKFWAPKPRMTDNQIAKEMGLSRSQFYRRLNCICLELGHKLGTDL